MLRPFAGMVLADGGHTCDIVITYSQFLYTLLYTYVKFYTYVIHFTHL